MSWVVLWRLDFTLCTNMTFFSLRYLCIFVTKNKCSVTVYRSSSWIHQWQLSETEKVNKMLGIIKKDITNMAKSHFAIMFLVLLPLSLVCDHSFYWRLQRVRETTEAGNQYKLENLHYEEALGLFYLNRSLRGNQIRIYKCREVVSSVTAELIMTASHNTGTTG